MLHYGVLINCIDRNAFLLTSSPTNDVLISSRQLDLIDTFHRRNIAFESQLPQREPPSLIPIVPKSWVLISAYSSKTELKKIKESIHRLLVPLNSTAVVQRVEYDDLKLLLKDSASVQNLCTDLLVFKYVVDNSKTEFEVLNIIQWAGCLGSNLTENPKDVFVITRILLVEAWVLIKITILSLYVTGQFSISFVRRQRNWETT